MTVKQEAVKKGKAEPVPPQPPQPAAAPDPAAPLPNMGYACLNVTLRNDGKQPTMFNNRTCRLATLKAKVGNPLSYTWVHKPNMRGTALQYLKTPAEASASNRKCSKRFTGLLHKHLSHLHALMQGLEFVSGLALQNCRDLLPILQWNAEHGIKLFRHALSPGLPAFDWSQVLVLRHTAAAERRD